MASSISCPRGCAQDARRGAGFVVMLASSFVMLAGGSAPSPFYPVLQARLGFSPLAMTSIFAVYAGALLAMLLITGSLSDRVGRRPVIGVGLLLLATSFVLFGSAGSVPALIAARVVQGIATGLLLSPVAAAVVDFEPRPGVGAVFNGIVPTTGLAFGALAAGAALDAFDAAPAIVFGGLALSCVVLAAALLALPETAPVRGTPSARPGAGGAGPRGIVAALRPTVGVPAPARRLFWRSAPAVVAGWSTGGLTMSLGAAIVGRELGMQSHLGQGLVVALVAGVGAVASYAAQSLGARAITLIGTASLAVGTGASLAALAAQQIVAYLLCLLVVGVGFGTSFLGVLKSLAPTVGAGQRAELFASLYTLSYLSFGVPAVLIGLAIPHLGLVAATFVYGGAITALASLAWVLRVRASE